MKKLLLLLLFVALCVVFIVVKTEERGVVFVSPLKYHISDDSTAEVIKDDSYEDLKSVTIPSEIRTEEGVYLVTSINKSAFPDCRELTNIELPSSVTNIGENAFGKCSALININVASDNYVFSSENGMLYDKNKTKLICVPRGKKGSIEIPLDVTSIGEYAFFVVTN